jgi:hypothetical protein
MLYDVAYPAFIAQLAQRVASGGDWEIFDYDWNRVLYPAELLVKTNHE